MTSVPSFAHEHQGAPYEDPLSSDSSDWLLHVPAVSIDKKDADTPDAWVPRDSRILRLTGRHPLNCEPPMDHLMAAGFVTPVSIHYVRNHGAAPNLNWNTHTLTVNGLVEKPMTLSMDELLKFPSVTLPVTLVCAGNRRKEENMLKKSIGFNWGPCAVSTTYWTGVRLCDLLRAAGIKSPEEGANFVTFRGIKNELPKGNDGSYGTSLTIARALDPSNDVIIAYKQNHRWLTPDHGFPVRIIIPGFIGGRMVKWLDEITVASEESQNHYHYMDNRVLPAHVDEELAKKEGWWYKPDFIINELNINSAVARPWHDEVVSLRQNTMYTMKGYAYTGGGRKVIRVEVSLNGGTVWQLADVQRFEKPNAYGKYWCWIHWELQVPVLELLAAPTKEILVRAWDDAMNTQPSHITWNVMGMMNNCHFRILIHPHVDAEGNMALRFQHPAPVEVGALGNIGWREEENLKRQALADALPATTQSAPVVVAAAAVTSVSGGPAQYTMEEVAQHTTEQSCWFVVEGKVYDATKFLEEHPGGAESILISAGQDATDEFNSIHSSKAKGMLKDYYIGDLVTTKTATTTTTAVTATASAASTSAPVSGPIALNPREKIDFKLAEKIELSHNVRLFRFALQSPEHRFGLPVGKHVFLYASINGETVMRAYTPTSSDDELGHFDLVIKVYRANEHPKFPEGGKMSQHLDTLAIGDSITVKGPLGHFVYEGQGKYVLNGKHVHSTSSISMIAGGTGITPCYQVIKAVLKEGSDVQLALLLANQCEDDILLREELEGLAAQHSNFKLWYTLDRPPAEGWKYSSGFINEEMVRHALLPASKDGVVLMCGPPPMIKFACVPNLEKVGYTAEQMITF